MTALWQASLEVKGQKTAQSSHQKFFKYLYFYCWVNVFINTTCVRYYEMSIISNIS